MLAPIDAAWMVLKAGVLHKESRLPPQMPEWSSTHQGYREDPLLAREDEEPSDGDEEQTARDKGHTQDVADVSPEAEAPVDAAAALAEVMRRKKLEGA